jgi:L-lactate utilization protein LutC
MLHKQNNKIKELEQKVITQAHSGYKAQLLESYKSEKNYNKFEQFIYDYNNWCIDTHQKESSSVRLVSQFLKDKAAQWYMANVAPRQGAYTMSKLYQELFDYCFPPYFKEDLHKKYNEKKQGGVPYRIISPIWHCSVGD